MVNRIFTSKDFKVDGNFAKTLRDKFNVNINSIDFSNRTLASETINKIISISTNGTIPDFIPEGNLNSKTTKIVS
jgi:serine protease inhibitor